MLTLDEYYYLLGLPVTDHVPFPCLEREPKSYEIVSLIHFGKFEIEANMTTKGGFRGLPAQFLLEKACSFAKMNSTCLQIDLIS